MECSQDLKITLGQWIGFCKVTMQVEGGLHGAAAVNIIINRAKCIGEYDQAGSEEPVAVTLVS